MSAKSSLESSTGGERTFTLQLLYLWTARAEDAGYARPCLDLVEKGISAPHQKWNPSNPTHNAVILLTDTMWI
jgi:hypothetical protein